MPTTRSGEVVFSPNEKLEESVADVQRQLAEQKPDGGMSLRAIAEQTYRSRRMMDYLEASGQLHAPAKGAEGKTGMESSAKDPGSPAAKEGQHVVDTLRQMGDAAGINDSPGMLEGFLYAGNKPGERAPMSIQAIDYALKVLGAVPELVGKAAKEVHQQKQAPGDNTVNDDTSVEAGQIIELLAGFFVNPTGPAKVGKALQGLVKGAK